MSILVVGASGATGTRLVEELLDRGLYVKAVVRSRERIVESLRSHDRLSLIIANILELSDEEMKSLVKDCHSIASCLGHNPTFKGVFGNPRRLVADATRRLCLAVRSNHSGATTKFILMNTVANRNRDLKEPISFAQKSVVALLRLLVPPQRDNEEAAEYLRSVIGQNDDDISWAAVRPSALINAEESSEVETYPSPTRSILNDGEVSRINVAHFMADLITDDKTWNKWKGQMPVIYNKGMGSQ